jgi:hypothetical protein
VSSAITREAIVACARTYIGTKFQHQGRLRGRGLDCIGLPIMVAVELGIRDRDGNPATPMMFGSYPPQPVGRAAAVRKECERLLIEKPIADARPGDVVAIRLPLEPCHIAMIAELELSRCIMPSLIHAYASSKKVVEHILDDRWRWRIDGAFSFPGID